MPSKRNTKKSGSTNKNSRKNRPSPSESATLFPVGTIKRGNDKNDYVVVATSTGVQRWVPILNAEINGIRLLTLDYIAKHIGKTFKYLEGEYQSQFPKSFKADRSKYLRIDTFTPNGDIEIKGKIIKDWFKTRQPALPEGFSLKENPKGLGALSLLPDRTMIFVLSNNPDELPLQIDSQNKKVASTNVMNMQAWIKTGA